MATRKKSSSKESSSQKMSVMVTIADANQNDMDGVIDQMKEAGFEEGQTIKMFGKVQGWIEADKVSSLEKIKGVEQVRPELTFSEQSPQ
jgi:hypothetical protein